MKVKIGQEIKSAISFETETFGGRKITIKEGDKGIVAGSGFILHSSGNASGMIQMVDNMELEGYDYENISKMILNRLNVVFGLEEFLENEEIDPKEIIDELEDLLSDIL